MSEQPERTEHGGPVVPNDAWRPNKVPLWCSVMMIPWPHAWRAHPSYRTYDECVRCGAIRPRLPRPRRPTGPAVA